MGLFQHLGRDLVQMQTDPKGDRETPAVKGAGYKLMACDKSFGGRIKSLKRSFDVFAAAGAECEHG